MYRFIPVLLLIVMASCQSPSNPQDQETLKKANDLHLEAMDIAKKMKPQLEDLVNFKNQTNIQGRALTEEEQSLVSQVEGLENRIKYWEENHIEVPGFDHHHDHDHSGHDHSHDHSPKPDILPKDMLLIQQEFKDSILAIQKDVLALSGKVKNIQPELN